MLLQTTLCLAAAAAVINLWLGIRISRVRMSAKILHGDGGNEALMRRMRAQANFIENVPLALILIGAIELSGPNANGGGKWLAIVGGLFMLARLAHALGMDSTRPNPLRAGGTLVTMLTLLGLAVVAILIALGRF